MLKEPRRPSIAVIGGSQVRLTLERTAHQVGREIAVRGAVLINGGLGGVMAAAAEGARQNGGHTIGILPGYNLEEANPYIEFPIATGIGHARNVLVVASADAVLALEGEAGTLSEIGLALKLGRPVVALNSWREVSGLRHAQDPGAAVALALELARRPRRRTPNPK